MHREHDAEAGEQIASARAVKVDHRSADLRGENKHKRDQADEDDGGRGFLLGKQPVSEIYQKRGQEAQNGDDVLAVKRALLSRFGQQKIGGDEHGCADQAAENGHQYAEKGPVGGLLIFRSLGLPFEHVQRAAFTADVMQRAVGDLLDFFARDRLAARTAHLRAGETIVLEKLRGPVDHRFEFRQRRAGGHIQAHTGDAVIGDGVRVHLGFDRLGDIEAGKRVVLGVGKRTVEKDGFAALGLVQRDHISLVYAARAVFFHAQTQILCQ